MSTARKKTHARNKLRKANVGFWIRETEKARIRAASPKIELKSEKNYSDAKLMISMLGLTLASLILMLSCLAHGALGLLNIIYYGEWMEIRRLAVGLVFGVLFGMLFYLLCPVAWAILVECAHKCFRKER